MPTYQYACTACEHRFEAVQSFSDAALTDCPQCQGKLRKVFSSVGIVFKGSGFYRTDSRSGSSSISNGGKPSTNGGKEPAAAAASSSSDSGSGSSSSSSSSSTPAAAAS
ncbi:FmdB family zinc ribbon protein [Pseudonocardia hispaniensis]